MPYRGWAKRLSTIGGMDLHADLSTPQVLAMSYVESQPIDALADAPRTLRDLAATRLIGLVLSELFSFRLMQTAPNLRN